VMIALTPASRSISANALLFLCFRRQRRIFS
jgi:hypothetical protein